MPLMTGQRYALQKLHATGRGVVRPPHSSNTLAQTASRPKDQALGAISIIQVWHSLQCKARSLQLLFQLSFHLAETSNPLGKDCTGSQQALDSLVGHSLNSRGLGQVNFHF